MKQETQKKRVLISLQDLQRERIEEIQDLICVNSYAETLRYLISRGIEASAPQLTVMRLLRKMEHEYSPQELLPLIDKLEGVRK